MAEAHSASPAPTEPAEAFQDIDIDKMLADALSIGEHVARVREENARMRRALTMIRDRLTEDEHPDLNALHSWALTGLDETVQWMLPS